MVKPRMPFLAYVTLVCSTTGWAAAFYGALYIAATGNVVTAETLWIFGWPFVTMLRAREAIAPAAAPAAVTAAAPEAGPVGGERWVA